MAIGYEPLHNSMCCRLGSEKNDWDKRGSGMNHDGKACGVRGKPSFIKEVKVGDAARDGYTRATPGRI